MAFARRLLGCRLLVRGADGARARALCITEVEPATGRTIGPRTAVMSGPAGHWYVYFCYGVHEMLNLVTGRRTIRRPWWSGV